MADLAEASVYLGEVVRVDANSVRIRLGAALKPGDGVVFDAGHPEEEEEGGRVYSVHNCGDECTIAFGRDDLDLSRIHVGDKIWKTSDPALQRALQKTTSGAQPNFQRPLRIEVRGCARKPMTVIFRDELENVIQVNSRMPLSPAEKQPIVTETLRQQLGRLGGTPFKLAHLENDLVGTLILPFSEMNRLRREAVSGLEALRMRPKRWTLESGGPTALSVENPSNPAFGSQRDEDDAKPSCTANLIVLVRSLAQLEHARLRHKDCLLRVGGSEKV